MMSIDYSQIADFLRDELQQFLRAVRQTENEDMRRAAVERLWAEVNRVEVFSYAPGEEQWNDLPESQRWGYLRLESYIGTALHELRLAQRMIWQVHHSLPITREERAQSQYA